MKSAAEYRKFAEECRDLAGKLSQPEDKRAVLLMAAAWEKVANEREAQLRRTTEGGWAASLGDQWLAACEPNITDRNPTLPNRPVVREQHRTA
jgi:hypothetical protein